jgi:serine-type D-Ala-D-Ala carboxypeptidase (penicillin-binding protein 5/6)
MNQLFKEYLPIFLFGLLGVIFVLTAGLLVIKDPSTQGTQQAAVITAVVPLVDPFADIDLQAKAVVVYDLESGAVLYAKNGEEALPLASITKVMTALVAREELPAGSWVTMTGEALSVFGQHSFNYGENWRVEDLIDLSLINSSNQAARALGLAVEARTASSMNSKMNSKAQALGLSTLYFQNETGLDLESGGASSRGSAYDVAQLLAYILKAEPDLLHASTLTHTTKTTPNQVVQTAWNTNDRINELPNLLASKTGFTNSANGNLAIAFDAGLNQPVAIVVLGSTQSGRFTDVIKLVEKTFDYFIQKNS